MGNISSFFRALECSFVKCFYQTNVNYTIEYREKKYKKEKPCYVLMKLPNRIRGGKGLLQLRFRHFQTGQPDFVEFFGIGQQGVVTVAADGSDDPGHGGGGPGESGIGTALRYPPGGVDHQPLLGGAGIGGGVPLWKGVAG